jgi:hypothetical protein
MGPTIRVAWQDGDERLGHIQFGYFLKFSWNPIIGPLPPPVLSVLPSHLAGTAPPQAARRAPTPCARDVRRTRGWPRQPHLHPRCCSVGSGSLPMPCTSTTLEMPYKLVNGLTTPTSVPQCRAAGRRLPPIPYRSMTLEMDFRRPISQQGRGTRRQESAHRRPRAGRGHIILGIR